MKPVVAIVGRPNVGKSTLFNRIIGEKVAVVEDIPGLTRDRLYGEAEWSDKRFIVVDTGGFQPLSDSDEARPRMDMLVEVKKQAITAVEEADIVIMLMDAEKGLLPVDVELGDILRKYEKKVYYAVNKIDGPSKEKALYEFYSFGTDLFPVSALTGYGLDDLLDNIAAEISEGQHEELSEYSRLAIVGRPNVGKSTFVNSLLGRDRMIVSSVPGTTRDSVDSFCSYYKKKYIIVDTAGIRKKGKMARTFEKYSFIRTLKNIENCDVALILFDSVDSIVELDQRIAGLVYEAGKGAVILFNKWDLLEKTADKRKKLIEEFQQKIWFMKYAPILTISALNRQRVTKIFPLINEIIAESSRRISTKQLNTFLRDCVKIKRPSLYRGKQVKLSYISQVGIKPPRFVIFTNKKEGIKAGYVRFLERQLRDRFPFKGVPLRLYIRQKP